MNEITKFTIGVIIFVATCLWSYYLGRGSGYNEGYNDGFRMGSFQFMTKIVHDIRNEKGSHKTPIVHKINS